MLEDRIARAFSNYFSFAQMEALYGGVQPFVEKMQIVLPKITDLSKTLSASRSLAYFKEVRQIQVRKILKDMVREVLIAKGPHLLVIGSVASLALTLFVLRYILIHRQGKAPEDRRSSEAEDASLNDRAKDRNPSLLSERQKEMLEHGAAHNVISSDPTSSKASSVNDRAREEAKKKAHREALNQIHGLKSDTQALRQCVDEQSSGLLREIQAVRMKMQSAIGATEGALATTEPSSGFQSGPNIEEASSLASSWIATENEDLYPIVAKVNGEIFSQWSCSKTYTKVAEEDFPNPLELSGYDVGEPVTLYEAQKQETTAIGRQIEFSGETNFLVYLSNALREQRMSASASNEKEVVFAEGNIFFASPEHPRQERSYIQWKLLLAETYGLDLVERVIARYGLEGKQPKWIDVKKVLVGIGANAKQEDFELLYQSMRDNFTADGRSKKSPQEMTYLCALQIPEAERKRILEAPSFQDLDDEQIELLEKAFRTVVIGNEQRYTSECLFYGKNKSQGLVSFDCFNNDLCLLNGFTFSLREAEDVTFAVSEYMSKTLVYQDLKEGMIVPILNADNKKTYFVVKNVYVNEILFNILVPVNAKKKGSSLDKPLPMYLHFRGTQVSFSKQYGPTGTVANLDPNGIAFTIFKNQRENLKNTLRKVLAELDGIDHVRLDISGHSQGGVHSARALDALVDSMANEEDFGGFGKICKITMHAHNSPAPEAPLYKHFNANIAKLYEKSPQIAISLTYLFFLEDAVQTFGDCFLGLDADQRVERSAVLLSAEEVRGTGASHRALVYSRKTLDADPRFSETVTFQKEILDDSQRDKLNELLRSGRPEVFDGSQISSMEYATKVVQYYVHGALVSLLQLIPASQKLQRRFL